MSLVVLPSKVDMFANNDNAINLRLYDNGAKAYFDDTATVTATLLNFQGVDIRGVTLALVTGSVTGDFFGKMTLNKEVIPATGYTLFIEATQGGAHNTWPLPCEVHPG